MQISGEAAFVLVDWLDLEAENDRILVISEIAMCGWNWHALCLRSFEFPDLGGSEKPIMT